MRKTIATKHFTFGITLHTWGLQILAGRHGIDAQVLCFWGSWTR